MATAAGEGHHRKKKKKKKKKGRKDRFGAGKRASEAEN
jgi:hypothetical protein